jgi:hypothetical protein
VNVCQQDTGHEVDIALFADRNASLFSYRGTAAIGSDYETGRDPLRSTPIHKHSGFGPALYALNTNPAAHFHAGIFRGCEQWIDGAVSTNLAKGF